jgi:hypothetical protein
VASTGQQPRGGPHTAIVQEGVPGAGRPGWLSEGCLPGGGGIANARAVQTCETLQGTIAVLIMPALCHHPSPHTR